MECNFENCPNFERLGKKFADRISELEQENAELKAYKDVNEDFKTAWEELKAENERLKYQILKWQKAYSRQYQINENKGYNKKEEQYRQTLQEIKELINTCMEFRTCERCKFFKMCDKDLEGCILSLITKAEEE